MAGSYRFSIRTIRGGLSLHARYRLCSPPSSCSSTSKSPQLSSIDTKINWRWLPSPTFQEKIQLNVCLRKFIERLRLPFGSLCFGNSDGFDGHPRLALARGRYCHLHQSHQFAEKRVRNGCSRWQTDIPRSQVFLLKKFCWIISTHSLSFREQRLTHFFIFLLVGLSVFMTPVLKFIPMPVRYANLLLFSYEIHQIIPSGSVRSFLVHGNCTAGWDAILRPSAHRLHAVKVPTWFPLPATGSLEACPHVHFGSIGLLRSSLGRQDQWNHLHLFPSYGNAASHGLWHS